MSLEAINGVAYSEEPHKPDELLDRFVEIANIKSQVHIESRPMMRQAYEWIGETVLRSGEFADDIRGLFVRKPTIMPHYALEVALRAVNAVELQADPKYAQGRDNGDAWNDTEEHVLSPRYNPDFVVSLGYDIATNQDRRGMLLKSLFLASGREEPLTFVELGASQFHIGKKLSEHQESGRGYGVTEVFTGFGEGQINGVEAIVPVKNPALSASFNNLVQNIPLELEMGIGIDVFRPTDRKNWPLSSLYIDELARPDIRNEFRRFSSLNPSNVTAYQADMAQPFDEDRFKKATGKNVPLRSKAALFSYSLYQLKNNAERAAALQTAHDMIEDDGMIVIIDAVDIKPDNSMIFYDNRLPYVGAVWMLDKRDPDPVFKKMFTLESGRAQRLRPESALNELSKTEELGLAAAA